MILITALMEQAKARAFYKHEYVTIQELNTICIMSYIYKILNPIKEVRRWNARKNMKYKE